MTITRLDGTPLDEVDTRLVNERLGRRALIKGPRIGDLVVFHDGPTRFIAHIWPDGIQVSAGGSFYLAASGGLSFSGQPFHSVDSRGLVRVAQKAQTKAWIFHHDQLAAGNGIEINIPARCYSSPLAAPA
jgi:hypothetical protein